MAPQLPVGRQLRLSVDAVLTDGSRERITSNAQWISSNPEVIRFEPAPALPGTVHALAEGEADLEVRAGGLSAVAHVVVGPRALDAIALQFDERGPSLAKGEHVQVTALGTWSTGEVEDVTKVASWRSSDEQVLALDAAPGAVICHPHPMYGGSMDNNVVEAIIAAMWRRGYATLRFNFRGVGASEGEYDGGEGEAEDARAAVEFLAAQPDIDRGAIALAGYSFGAAGCFGCCGGGFGFVRAE